MALSPRAPFFFVAIDSAKLETDVQPALAGLVGETTDFHARDHGRAAAILECKTERSVRGYGEGERKVRGGIMPAVPVGHLLVRVGGSFRQGTARGGVVATATMALAVIVAPMAVAGNMTLAVVAAVMAAVATMTLDV